MLLPSNTLTVLLPEFLPPLSAGSVTEAPDKDAALAGLRRAIAWLWNNEKKALWPTLEALAQQEFEPERLRKICDTFNYISSIRSVAKPILAQK